MLAQQLQPLHIHEIRRSKQMQDELQIRVVEACRNALPTGIRLSHVHFSPLDGHAVVLTALLQHAEHVCAIWGAYR